MYTIISIALPNPGGGLLRNSRSITLVKRVILLRAHLRPEVLAGIKARGFKVKHSMKKPARNFRSTQDLTTITDCHWYYTVEELRKWNPILQLRVKGEPI